jgi:hypothetical protein
MHSPNTCRTQAHRRHSVHVSKLTLANDFSVLAVVVMTSPTAQLGTSSCLLPRISYGAGTLHQCC